MRHIALTLLFLILVPKHGFAQDNIESLEHYTPPPMFSEPSERYEAIEKAPAIKIDNSFKPPLPPKRPKSFKLSPEMLKRMNGQSITHFKNTAEKPTQSNIHNDIGNDIKILNSSDVHDSIDAN